MTCIVSLHRDEKITDLHDMGRKFDFEVVKLPWSKFS